MSFLLRKVVPSVVAVILGVSCLAGISGEAEADVIPNSVIVPHEYQFPPVEAIPKEGITGLLSYNLYRDEGDAYDGESQTRSLFASVNKFFHFFKFDGLDSVGFAAQALPGYARVVTKTDQSFSGMLDLPVGIMAYMKPTKNWTTGMEYWLVMPVGDNDLSGHSWDHQLAFLTNYVYGNFTFDGDIGYKLRGDSKYNGVQTENGDMLYASTVFGYKIARFLEPYTKFDYQSVATGQNKATGVKTQSKSELQWSIGNYMKITDKVQFTLHYTKGLVGSHTTKANGVEANFYIVF